MVGKHPAPLDSAALGFSSIDLASLAREMLKSEHTTRDGRAARTLVKGGLTVVLTVVPAGGGIPPHSAAGPAVIVPILGTARLTGDDGEPPRSVPTGSALFMGQGKRHEVKAAEDCAFLIILGRQG